MKKVILGLVLALSLAPLAGTNAQTDYYIKIDGVEGESTAIEVEKEVDRTSADSSESEKKGNVETEWKVEEGESATGGTQDINIGVGELENTGIEPDEIDNKMTDDEQESASGYLKIGDIKGESQENTGVEPDEIDNKMTDDDPQESNFAILLSSGDDSDGEKSEEDEALESELENILLQGLQEDEVPTEEVAFYYNKISTKHKQTVKLFGFIPVETTATVEVDSEENVKVKFPWWTFLASGKDREGLGNRVFQSLSNIMKINHDTMMNIIRNVK